MTWMQTASGIAFDLLEPTPDMVTLDDIAHHLAALCRFTGATTREVSRLGRRVPCHYSVAQHSWLVAEYVADHGCPEWGLRALLHDAHEAYTGDRSSPMKDACRTSAPLHYVRQSGLTGAGERYEDFTLAHPPDPFADIAERIQAAIEAKFGLGPASKDEHAAVKHADNVLLQTEKRDLMVNGGRPWSDGPAPWSRSIREGFEAWAAKEVFLSKFERFARLAPSRRGGV